MAKSRGRLAKNVGVVWQKRASFSRCDGLYSRHRSAQPDEPVHLADGDVIQVGEVVACYAAASALYEHS